MTNVILDALVPYRVRVETQICGTISELYSDRLTIQTGKKYLLLLPGKSS